MITTRQGNHRFDNIKNLSYYIENVIPTTRTIDLCSIVRIRVVCTVLKCIDDVYFEVFVKFIYIYHKVFTSENL